MSTRHDVMDRITRIFCGPDWRNQQAIACAGEERCRANRPTDPFIGRAVDCQRLLQDGRAALAQERYPDVVGAERIHADPALRHQIQMLVLGDCDLEVISARTTVKADTIAMYEALYFDARPMLDTLDWIQFNVIIAARQRGEHDRAADLQISYWGGRWAAEALIDGRSGLPTDQANRLHEAAILLEAKAQAALEMPLTPGTQLEYLRIYSEWLAAERQLDLKRQELAFRIERWAQIREQRRAKLARDDQSPDTAVAVTRDIPAAGTSSSRGEAA